MDKLMDIKPSQIAVENIVVDLSDRNSLQNVWENIDEDIQMEIKDAWAVAISNAYDEELAELKQTVRDYEECQEDKRRLCRDIAVIILGDSAPSQPSLCDIVKYVEELKAKLQIAREALKKMSEDGHIIFNYVVIDDVLAQVEDLS